MTRRNDGSRWPDGTPRSQNNAFTGHTTADAQPIDWSAFNTTAALRQTAADNVDRRRAKGAEVNPFLGVSSKVAAAQEVLRDRHGGQYTTAKGASTNKTARLRAALVVGPGTCAELAAATGIPAKHVSPLLSHDINAGRVSRTGSGNAYVYSLNSRDV